MRIKGRRMPIFTIDNKRGKWPGNSEEESEAQKCEGPTQRKARTKQMGMGKLA